MSDVSESLRSLTKNEQMSKLPVFLANRSFAHYSLIFRKKNSDSLRKPMSQFPTLISLAKSVRDKKCVRLLVTKENQKKNCYTF